MKNLHLAFALLAVSFASGFTWDSSHLVPADGDGYQCSPETYPCDYPWYFSYSVTVDCCCDDNADQHWHKCAITVDAYARDGEEYAGWICWRRVNKGPEGSEVCYPAPLLGNLYMPAADRPCCSLPK